MSCVRPLRAYRDPVTKDVRIGYDHGKGRWFEVPCAKCVGCKLEKARAWSLRIMHESLGYDSNLCLTLDYRPEDLRSPSLDYSDFQGFMKRLRRRAGGGVRFFVAGEYGERFGRPHFHAILFNGSFPDLSAMHNGRFRSRVAEEVWGLGNVVIDRLNPAAAAYVAGYTLKKARAAAYADSVVDVRTGELCDRVPPFVRMSLKPGIGAFWYKRFGRDILPHDFAIADGCKYKVPRYYFKKFAAEFPLLAEEVQWQRELRAREHPEESTAERRAVREEYLVRREQFRDSHSL